MKKYKFLLLFILLTLFATIATWQLFFKNSGRIKPEIQVPRTQKESFLKVYNRLKIYELTTKGQITKNKESLLFFNVEGKLESGEIELKQGTEFKFNQLLYKIDSEELFYSICAQKASLAIMILEQMDFIALNFGAEKSKWQQFLNDFSMVKTLPEFPKVESKAEKLFILETTILSEYMKVRSLEKKMSNYILLAPFDGKVIEIYTELGTFVNPKIQIAKISKNSNFEVIVPIELSYMNSLNKGKLAHFFDASGFEIGKGKMINEIQKTAKKNQTIEVYFSFEPTNKAYFYRGETVTVAIEFEKPLSCSTVPFDCVKDKKITVLIKKRIVKRNVIIIDSKADSLIVSGLKYGDKVML